jgi:predicted small metal-binding protein
MDKVVTCPCGEVMRASSDDEMVRIVGKHAREVHNQPEPSREEVLSMAKPA